MKLPKPVKRRGFVARKLYKRPDTILHGVSDWFLDHRFDGDCHPGFMKPEVTLDDRVELGRVEMWIWTVNAINISGDKDWDANFGHFLTTFINWESRAIYRHVPRWLTGLVNHQVATTTNICFVLFYYKWDHCLQNEYCIVLMHTIAHGYKSLKYVDFVHSVFKWFCMH